MLGIEARRAARERSEDRRRQVVPAAGTAAAAAAAAAAGTATRTLFGLVDSQRATVEVGAVHRCDGLLRVLRGAHRHEAEAARLPALAVGDEVHIGHLTELGERGAD